MLYLPVILGTARQGRQSEKVANYLHEQLKKRAIETDIIDVRDYLNCFTENSENKDGLAALGKQLERADGYVIVTPEYNHGYPGELKLMLDNFYGEYARKAVGVCGVSIGALGGARAVEQVKLVVGAFHAAPISESIYFPNINSLFDEEGAIQDETYEKRVDAFVKELTWFASALKEARQNTNY